MLIHYKAYLEALLIDFNKMYLDLAVSIIVLPVHTDYQLQTLY